MGLTEEKLKKGIEMLRHGGSEAIALFMEISESLYDADGEEALQNWVTVAAPVLPEQERIEIVTVLLSELFRTHDGVQSELTVGGSHPTLH
jgi:hypothetical protein